jgi:hypothetical protein
MGGRAVCCSGATCLGVTEGPGPPASGVKVALVLLKELELSAVRVRFALAFTAGTEQALELLASALQAL